MVATLQLNPSADAVAISEVLHKRKCFVANFGAELYEREKAEEWRAVAERVM